jgi:hypothetical protein
MSIFAASSLGERRALLVKVSIYRLALRYADMCEGTVYCNSDAITGNEDVVGKYHKAVLGGSKPLSFTLYVPVGFGVSDQMKIPNTQETNDIDLIFAAAFGNGETWKELRLSEFNLRWNNAS